MRRILAEVTTEVMREAGFAHVYTHLSNAARGLAAKPEEKLTKEQSEAAKRGEYVAANERNKPLVAKNRRYFIRQIKTWIESSTSVLLTMPSSPVRSVPKLTLPPLTATLQSLIAERFARTATDRVGATARALPGSKLSIVTSLRGIFEPAVKAPAIPKIRPLEASLVVRRGDNAPTLPSPISPATAQSHAPHLTLEIGMTCIAFFALQTVYSHWWLARYRFGPMEWLWRALTYGERPPFRIVAGRPAPAL